MDDLERVGHEQELREACKDGILTAFGQLLDAGHREAALTLWRLHDWLPYPTNR